MKQRILAAVASHWIVFVCVMVTGLLALACAAPAPPRVTTNSAELIAGPAYYVIAEGTQDQAILDIVATFRGNQPIAIGSLPAMQTNYFQDKGLDDGTNGLHISTSSEDERDSLAQLIFPILIDRSQVTCTELDGQTLWAFNMESIAAMNVDVNNPDVADVVGECSEVAQEFALGMCKDCGCVGPMGGNPPRCTALGMNKWEGKPFITSSKP